MEDWRTVGKEQKRWERRQRRREKKRKRAADMALAAAIAKGALQETWVTTLNKDGYMYWFLRLQGTKEDIQRDEACLNLLCRESKPRGEEDTVYAGTAMCRVEGCTNMAVLRYRPPAEGTVGAAVQAALDKESRALRLRTQPARAAHPFLFTTQLVFCANHRGTCTRAAHMEELPAVPPESPLFVQKKRLKATHTAMLIRGACFVHMAIANIRKITATRNRNKWGKLTVRRGVVRGSTSNHLRVLKSCGMVTVYASHLATQAMHHRRGSYRMLKQCNVHPDTLHPAFPHQVALGHMLLREESTKRLVDESRYTPEFLRGEGTSQGSGRYAEMPPGTVVDVEQEHTRTFLLRTTRRRADRILMYAVQRQRPPRGGVGMASYIPERLLEPMTEVELQRAAKKEGGIRVLRMDQIGRRSAAPSREALEKWKKERRIEELGPPVFASLAHAHDMHCVRLTTTDGGVELTDRQSYEAYRKAYGMVARDIRPDRLENRLRQHLRRLHPVATPPETLDHGMYMSRLDGPVGVRRLTAACIKENGLSKKEQREWTHIRLQRRDKEGQWIIVTPYEAQSVFCEAWYQVLCDPHTLAGQSARALRKMLWDGMDVCVEGTDFIFRNDMVQDWTPFDSPDLMRCTAQITPEATRARRMMGRLLWMYCGCATEGRTLPGIRLAPHHKQECFTYELVLAVFLLFGPLPTCTYAPQDTPSHQAWRRATNRRSVHAWVHVPWDPRCLLWASHPDTRRWLAEAGMTIVEPTRRMVDITHNPYIFLAPHKDYRTRSQRMAVYTGKALTTAGLALAKRRKKAMSNAGCHVPWPAPVQIPDGCIPTHVVRTRLRKLSALGKQEEGEEGEEDGDEEDRSGMTIVCRVPASYYDTYKELATIMEDRDKARKQDVDMYRAMYHRHLIEEREFERKSVQHGSTEWAIKKMQSDATARRSAQPPTKRPRHPPPET